MEARVPSSGQLPQFRPPPLSLSSSSEGSSSGFSSYDSSLFGYRHRLSNIDDLDREHPPRPTRVIRTTSHDEAQQESSDEMPPANHASSSSGNTGSREANHLALTAFHKLQKNVSKSNNNRAKALKSAKNFSRSSKRLQKELAEITAEPPPNCSAGPKGDNMYEWSATILGPTGSVYEGGVFFLDLHFTQDYPFNPPVVVFRTRIYHCNVNRSGAVCLDVLDDGWSPALTVAKILTSISALVWTCDPNKPLVNPIAQQYLTDREEHDRIARQWTKRYAT